MQVARKVKAPVADIELQLHRTYSDRYGNKWKVTRQDVGYIYPFVALKVGSDQIETYAKDGRWSNYTLAGCDLINQDG